MQLFRYVTNALTRIALMTFSRVLLTVMVE